MAHELGLILTLTGGLTAALVFGLIAQRFRLSPLVGYLLAGLAVGPFTPGFVAEASIAEQLAELGVILLMFGVGLHFDLRDLLSVRKIAIPGAVAQIAVATALGVAVTKAFGWTLGSGVVYGLAISVASTVVLLRVLSDHDDVHTHAGHVAVGWLLVEDLFTVLVLVLLPILASAHSAGGVQVAVMSIGKAVLKIGALVAFTLVVGRRTIPALLAHVARTRSRELFTLAILVVALGIAVGSARLFGASMALGAFLAGMVVGQSDFSARAASEALPLRDAFAVLFFVSMGMLFDPSQLFPNLPLTAATLAIILIGKPLTAFFVTLALGRPAKTAVAVGIALAQIGEFSFMLAALGLHLHVLPPNASQALVAASVVSITLNPFLYRSVDPLTRWLARRRVVVDHSPRLDPELPFADRALVVGYGPIGQNLVDLLVDNEVEPTIVELNLDSVKRVQARGLHAVHGDASHGDVLVAAGIKAVQSVIFTTTPDRAAIALVRELNPIATIIVRASYASEAVSLNDAGAGIVVTGETEVAAAMAERLLERLGATAEQLDRARERVRAGVGPRLDGSARGAREG